jgi:hypothetical protein
MPVAAIAGAIPRRDRIAFPSRRFSVSVEKLLAISDQPCMFLPIETLGFKKGLSTPHRAVLLHPPMQRIAAGSCSR